MKPAPLPTHRAWVVLPVCALAFLFWIDRGRINRVEAISALPGWSVDAPVADAASPTGYAGGVRNLVVPQHNHASQEWIMQTQQMLQDGEWRLRQVMYDNASLGRETYASAPYRWWLTLVAWAGHVFSHRSLALSVEQAALYADPLLHGLLVLGATGLVGWRFGLFPAALLSVALVAWFPLAAAFLPGAPDHRALAWGCALASVLALLAGVAGPPGVARRWFFLAGLAGGLGLWISATHFVPLLAGVGLGALASAWVLRGESPDAAPGLPWRAWAWGGALASVAGYLVDNFPGRLGWRLEVNHPLYALAWLGGAELLARTAGRFRGHASRWSRRELVAVIFATLAVVALPVAMYRLRTRGIFIGNPQSARLTGLENFTASGIAAWYVNGGFTRLLGATCLPALLLVPAGWLFFQRDTSRAARVALALTLAPAGVAVGFAWFQLSWWSGADAMLALVLVAAVAATETAANRWWPRTLWAAGLAGIVIFGAGELALPRGPVEASLTDVEVEALTERDLAHWLARRAGPDGVVVFAPPNTTAALEFHGGARGLVGVFSWENQGGLTAMIRLASATTPDEALALVQRRRITYLVIPSWDQALDEFAGLGSSRAEGTFIHALHNWALPFWVRPVAYNLPVIPGFEQQSLLVLEVVEDQEPTVALSRVAEYFVDLGRPDLAAGTRVKLRQYPKNLSVLTALARVESSLGEQEKFAETFSRIVAALAGPGADNLPWDRRVSLAMVLARGDRFDLVRVQVQRCLAGVDEVELRALPTTSLFHLQMLARRLGLEISDPALRQIARDLLPPGQMRERLAQ